MPVMRLFDHFGGIGTVFIRSVLPYVCRRRKRSAVQSGRLGHNNGGSLWETQEHVLSPCRQGGSYRSSRATEIGQNIGIARDHFSYAQHLRGAKQLLA